MTDLEKIKLLLPGFKIEVDGKGDFTASFYTPGRIISFLEEEKCIDNIKKAGGKDIYSSKKPEVCKFSFKLN